MDSHLLHPLTVDKSKLHSLFEKIAAGNTILLLGAGASVTDNKKYLSSDIITYYEDKIGKQYGIPNITEFLDALIETPSFDRSEFDYYVDELLSKIRITDAHRTIMAIKWRQIITTNFDLLLEKAEMELKEESKSTYELVPVRNIKEYNHFCDNLQIQYVKLNGCMSDRKKFPFLFSTQDFKSAKPFYKTVLNSLKVLSDRITFLSAGYSYSDDFAVGLLKDFDSYNFRDRKSIWNIDPYVNDHKLALYKKQNVIIIKCSVTEFFAEYRVWEDENYKNKLISSKSPVFTNSRNSVLNLSNKVSYNLKGVVEQLNNRYKGFSITEEKYYKGEEPNYSVIENSYDVVRVKKLTETKSTIRSIVNQSSSLIPIIFLKGNFGTGKTTFNYRLIHDFLKDEDDSTAFEIIDIDNLKKEYLKDLIENVKSKSMIFFCNNIEVDSIYKSIIELRTYLSTLQFSEINIFFLLSIRENILELHKKSRFAKAIYEVDIDSKLTREEIDELIEKLHRIGMINYRDNLEKAQIVNKIQIKYDSDSFVTLVSLITDGKHIGNLRDAYFQLSKQCQKAFVYTALAHRFNLLLPSSVLKDLVSSDWEEFRNKVINVEGRGILIQEYVPVSKGADPDLYFRTKHPLIADLLVKEIHPSEDKRFKLYREVIGSMTAGTRTSRFVVNLIKAIKNSKEFNESRINSFYDEGHKIFENEPHYLLQYAMNLQARGGKGNIENAIDKIRHAETLLENRNDRFIHRKGVLYFRLAQIYYKEEKSELNLTLKYLYEAKEWLLLKQQLDPFTSFGYYDLLDLLIWELEKIKFEDEEVARKMIFIEDYLDLAVTAVNDNFEKISELRTKYENSFQNGSDNKQYLYTLNEMYENVKLRPFACILMYNYYVKAKDFGKSQELLDEIELYQEEYEVSKFLFKFYGRKLNNPNIRLKFFKLVRMMDWYESENPLRYNYYLFVAESYNMQIQTGNDYIRKIKDRYQSLNPEFQRYWNDADSETPRIFEGTVIKSKRGFKVFYCKEIGKEIWFSRANLEKVNIGDACKAHIGFYLSGLRAILILG